MHGAVPCQLRSSGFLCLHTEKLLDRSVHPRKLTLRLPAVTVVASKNVSNWTAGTTGTATVDPRSNSKKQAAKTPVPAKSRPSKPKTSGSNEIQSPAAKFQQAKAKAKAKADSKAASVAASVAATAPSSEKPAASIPPQTPAASRIAMPTKPVEAHTVEPPINRNPKPPKMTKQLKEQLEELYEALYNEGMEPKEFAPGPHRLVCPDCEGGTSGEVSLSLTIAPDCKSALFQCFRATCGNKGRVAVPDIAQLQLDAADSTDGQRRTSGATATTSGKVEWWNDPGRRSSAATPAALLSPVARAAARKAAVPLHEQDLTPETLAWFQSDLHIPQEVLQRHQVKLVWVARFPDEPPSWHVAFPYFKNKRKVNVSYYNIQTQQTWMPPGSERVLYGHDACVGCADVVLVESELDMLAVEAALAWAREQDKLGGRELAVAVLPGMGEARERFKHSRQLIWEPEDLISLSNSQDALACHLQLNMAMRADEFGQALVQEVVRRLGPATCYSVRWPDKAEQVWPHSPALQRYQQWKDQVAAGLLPVTERFSEPWRRDGPLDVLIRDGAAALWHALSTARGMPISGLVSFMDVGGEVLDHYEGRSGAAKPHSTGWASMDPYYQVVPGELAVVTGVPNSGKSEFLDALAVQLMRGHGWPIAFCSLEKNPAQHALQLAEKLLGKPATQAEYSRGLVPMDESELMHALQYIDKFCPVIRPEDDEAPSIDFILEAAKSAVLRYGIRGLIIDPYNELDHSRPKNITETEHVSAILSKIKRFAQKFQVHVWFVAHPKILRDWRGKPPSLYEIAGSSHFVNKCDVGLVVYRDLTNGASGSEVKVKTMKVRNKNAGRIGEVILNYDRGVGVYRETAQIAAA